MTSNRTYNQRRTRARLLAALAACIACAAPALAQTYPAKPVRFIVTNPPGGTADILARAIGEEMGKSMGQQFVVENRPGANGNIGAELLVKSPADGYTLLITPPGPLATNAALYKSLPFDPKTAFAPISTAAVAPLLLVVNPALPARNAKELVDYAHANPGKLSSASQGNASTGHLALELLKASTSADIAHVPYKGSAPALTDLVAGHVQMMFDNTTSSLPHVRQGRLRALGVAELKRLRGAPEIPTLDESGLKGFEATPWFGVVARAGTPEEILKRLNDEMRAALSKPEMDQRFTALGVELRPMRADDFARFIKAETAKWEKVIRASGAKAD